MQIFFLKVYKEDGQLYQKVYTMGILQIKSIETRLLKQSGFL